MPPPTRFDIHAALAARLLNAVRQQNFGAEARPVSSPVLAPDSPSDSPPATPFPSLDLALVAFDPQQPAAARWANVLFSREHPEGLVAQFDGAAGRVVNIRFDRDQRDAAGTSVAFTHGSNWQSLTWTPLQGNRGLPRVVAPYPASLLKLMVAVGIGLALDRGLIGDWPDALAPMITISDNDATDTCVALLHRVGMVDVLNERFAELGLHTLQLNGTTPAGGWRNADGAGVGMIHMTAWDTVRLLWLLDADAPPAPWLSAAKATLPLLQPATRDHLRAVLQRQQFDEILSSGSLRGVPGWLPGLPDAPGFAHKTGCTDSYASDAGILRVAGTATQAPLHALVAVLSSLGRHHAPDPRCATTWRLPALGAAIESLLRADATPNLKTDP